MSGAPAGNMMPSMKQELPSRPSIGNPNPSFLAAHPFPSSQMLVPNNNVKGGLAPPSLSAPAKEVSLLLTTTTIESFYFADFISNN